MNATLQRPTKIFTYYLNKHALLTKPLTLDPTPLTHERILALGFVESCKLPGAAKCNIGNRLINLFFDGTLAKISELNYNAVRTVGQLVKVLNLFRIRKELRRDYGLA